MDSPPTYQILSELDDQRQSYDVMYTVSQKKFPPLNSL